MRTAPQVMFLGSIAAFGLLTHGVMNLGLSVLDPGAFAHAGIGIAFLLLGVMLSK